MFANDEENFGGALSETSHVADGAGRSLRLAKYKEKRKKTGSEAAV